MKWMCFRVLTPFPLEHLAFSSPPRHVILSNLPKISTFPEIYPPDWPHLFLSISVQPLGTLSHVHIFTWNSYLWDLKCSLVHGSYLPPLDYKVSWQNKPSFLFVSLFLIHCVLHTCHLIRGHQVTINVSQRRANGTKWDVNLMSKEFSFSVGSRFSLSTKLPLFCTILRCFSSAVIKPLLFSDSQALPSPIVFLIQMRT